MVYGVYYSNTNQSFEAETEQTKHEHNAPEHWTENERHPENSTLICIHSVLKYLIFFYNSIKPKIKDIINVR